MIPGPVEQRSWRSSTPRRTRAVKDPCRRCWPNATAAVLWTPLPILRTVWRRLRLHLQVQRVHAEMLEEYCKAHRREAAMGRR
jgi:hypothetical protein